MYARKTVVSFPIARRDGLLIQAVGSETVVYDRESKQAHCLKPLAALVFERADGSTSIESIAAAAEAQLGEPVAPDAIRDAVTQLETSGLLEVPLVIHDGLSRRDLVRRAGYVGAGAAFAAPLISSIVAPTAAMAVSGIATGCSGCGKNPDCVSNHCCQNNAGKHCSQGCCVGSNNSCHFCNCTGSTCQCTVTPAEAGISQCPCICGSPGCVNVPCCPTLNERCCTNEPAC